MKRMLLISLLAACFAGTVQAGIVTFTFDSLAEDADATAISNYMSTMYGSSVTVSNARIEQNPVNAQQRPDWTGNTGSFVWTYGAGNSTPNMDIFFNTTPITRMQFDGFVFLDTGDVDFQVKAYANGSQVYWKTWNVGAGQTIAGGPIDFGGQLVDHLWFSDSGRRDIGIDNLAVNAVPLPASILLGAFAVGLAGRKLWKFV